MHSADTCNQYLPNDSTINRFVWVVKYLAANGFYVIVDDHTEDPTVRDVHLLHCLASLSDSISSDTLLTATASCHSLQVVTSKSQFISYWVDLVTRISQDSVASQRLIIDILNEPDARGWGWDTMSVSFLMYHQCMIMQSCSPVPPRHPVRAST